MNDLEKALALIFREAKYPTGRLDLTGLYLDKLPGGGFCPDTSAEAGSGGR